MDLMFKTIGQVVYVIGWVLMIIPLLALIVMSFLLLIPVLAMLPGAVLIFHGAELAGIDLENYTDEV